MVEQNARMQEGSAEKELVSETSPIIYVVSNGIGLGHSSRATEIGGQIGRRAPVVYFIHSEKQKRFMTANLDQTRARYGLGDYYYDMFPGSWHERTDKDMNNFLKNNGNLLERAVKGGVFITDFVAQTPYVVGYLEDQGLSIPTVAITHSLENTSLSRQGMTRQWRENNLDIASYFDVVFHIGLFGNDSTITQDIPGQKTQVKYCGPAAKPVTRPPEEIKKELGLSCDSEFVLIKPGLSEQDPAYTLMQTAAQEKTDNIYVVQGWNQLAMNTTFPENFIFAPTRPDGQNYINAAKLVITKPGFATSSECVATGTPLGYLHTNGPEGETNIELLEQFLEGVPVTIDPERNITQQIKALQRNGPEISERFSSITCDGANVIADHLVSAREQTMEDSTKKMIYTAK